jgi:hypothetical protein
MLSNLGHLYGYTFELMIKQSISQSQKHKQLVIYQKMFTHQIADFDKNDAKLRSFKKGFDVNIEVGKNGKFELK